MMKYFILFIYSFLSISYVFGNEDPLSKTTEAFVRTKYGKNVKKNIEKKIIRKIPNEFSAIAVLGIEQKYEIPFNKNNRIEMNYREKKIFYKFEMSF